MDKDLILRQNPWWTEAGLINEEPRIAALQRTSLVWHPPFIDTLDVSQDSVHILTGPRQVGKSTAVRLLMRNLLLDKKVPPRNILLFNCDILKEPSEITQLVTYFLENISAAGRKYFFLDEVTAVEKWPYGIKWLIDNGKDRECFYLLTGSSTIQLKKSGEYLPGRRGKGKDWILFPLSFQEYVKLVKPARSIPDLSLSDLNFPAAQKIHSQLLLDLPEITSLFDNYCLHGGFLKPLNEIYDTKIIAPETVEIYLSWIRGEIAKDKKREHTAQLLLEKISLSLGSGLSYQALSEYMDAGSHNTARAYLDFFQNIFVIDEVPFEELSQKRIAWKKNRKYYFSDPFLYWISNLWFSGGDNLAADFAKTLANPERLGVVMENIVETHLRRIGFSPTYGQVQGKEVDFAIQKNGIGVEVKYQKKVTASDAAPLKTFKKGFLVTRDTLQDLGQTLGLPAWLFCLMDR